ncbi:MAG: LysM peptidoglycan-binding domain-containing protein [Shimia sp.]|uniref:LysM peptidoglycan-binding domain-containing protein n=1 Tax=Shimia sp. TaxID=1954381 RepID=UPI001B2DD009|nr:LysM peptidoglycan-binding domain-containing protein [Shimia sp.]MBO6898696.1 LysM peptidoglycan-binding domain-containing protein [Shimia sp.]
MSDKASIFSGNVAWVAGVVVAMGVSVFALVSTGVLDGSDQTVTDDKQTESTVPTTERAQEASGQDTETPAASTDTQEQVTEAVEETAPPTEEAASSTDEAAPTISPSFDVVRVDAEGNTVVAGAAAPGAMLGILLDGTEVALAPVDPAGKFAAILAIEPSEAPRVLSLVERRADGDVPSDATVIVAPVIAVAEASVAPEVVAQAEQTAENLEAETTQETAAIKEVTTDSVGEETKDTSQQVSSGDQAVEDVSESSVDVASEAAPEPEVKEETAAVEPAPAPKAPAVIVSDSEGVRVVQPAAPQEDTPEVLAAVSIDSISYTDTGAVMVSGRGNPSAFVRLYLDNTLAATTQIDDVGLWSTQLEDVAGGLYELRADEVDETAKVLSRVVTPFKRETPETVAKARAQAEAVAEAEAAAQEPGTPTEQTAETVAAPEDAGDEATAETATVEAKPETAPDASDASAPEVAAVEDAVEEAVATEAETSEAQVAESEASVAEVAEAETGVEEAAPSSPAKTEAPTTTQTSETSSQPKQATKPETATAQPPVRIVTVQPGATLWAIARDRYGEGQLYLQVFEANKDKIRDPDLIYPGQVFTVPEE